MKSRFGLALSAAAGQAAVAYGYTLTVWSSGAVVTSLDGKPAVGDAFLFIAGAVAAFALVDVVATRGFRDFRSGESQEGLLVSGVMHVVAAGVAVGCVALLASAVGGHVVWPLASFVATLAYLLLAGLQLWLGERVSG